MRAFSGHELSFLTSSFFTLPPKPKIARHSLQQIHTATATGLPSDPKFLEKHVISTQNIHNTAGRISVISAAIEFSTPNLGEVELS